MFKMQANELKGVVNSLAKGLSKKRMSQNPIFISTQDNTAAFYFSSELFSVEKRVQLDVQANLEVAVSALQMNQAVSALPDGEVLVEKDGHDLKLRWGRNSTISVNTIEETSPLITIPNVVDMVTWGPGALHGVARSMPYFCSVLAEQIQKIPVIAGPNFIKDPDTGEVFVKATDGMRAASVLAERIEWFDNKNFAIESSMLQSLAELMPETTEISVGMNESGSLLVFKAGNVTAVARPLEGKYPVPDKVFNLATPCQWRIDRRELIEVCQRVKKLTSGEARVLFKVEDEGVIAIVPHRLKQSIGVSIEGKSPDQILFNAEYLELAAHLYRTEEVILYITSNDKPVTLVGDGQNVAKTLVLPIRYS